ncbi:Zinc finger, CCHC-type [Sesbania bispinosa]|nr:Zinc finger, CCHC-type [Sesbania bispinosa]
MASWKHIHLKEAEEEDVVQLAVPEDENSADKVSQVYTIVCKLWTTDSFNVRAFKSTMINLWRTRNGLEILDLDKSLFSVRVFSGRDKDMILNGCPWTFDKHVFFMESLLPDATPSEVDIHACAFWTRVYELPMGYRSETVAQSIVSNIGSYIDWDKTNESRWGRFLRMRMMLDLRKPLRRGMVVQLPNKKKVKVFFKYEKLPNFCYICGRMGHVIRNCSDVEGELDEEELDNLPFGQWMGASPSRPTLMSKPATQVSQKAQPKKLFKESGTVESSHSSDQVVFESGEQEKNEQKSDLVEVEVLQKIMEKVDLTPTEKDVTHVANIPSPEKGSNKVDEEAGGIDLALNGVSAHGRRWKRRARGKTQVSSLTGDGTACNVSLIKKRNEINYDEEDDAMQKKNRMGGRAASINLCHEFHDCLNNCGLRDLGYEGYPFTWTNGRKGTTLIEQRLDRSLANDDFLDHYQHCVVTHLGRFHSDHAPLRIQWAHCQEEVRTKKKRKRIFRFEKTWLEDSRFTSCINRTWIGHGAEFSEKLKGTAEALTLLQKENMTFFWLRMSRIGYSALGQSG